MVTELLRPNSAQKLFTDVVWQKGKIWAGFVCTVGFLEQLLREEMGSKNLMFRANGFGWKILRHTSSQLHADIFTGLQLLQ